MLPSCQQQHGGQPRPQPQQQPQLHGCSDHCHQQQQPLKVVRSPLKRRSTGITARGLSRNYTGKSQSFDSIQELTRNPWGGETALSLAKRRALPLAVPLAAVHASPSLRPGASLCEGIHLSWSIDEEEECLLGGVSCRAALAPAASSSSDGGVCGGTLVACCFDDAADDAAAPRGGRTCAAPAAAAPAWHSAPAHVPVLLAQQHRPWGAPDCAAGGGGVGGFAASRVSRTAHVQVPHHKLIGTPGGGPPREEHLPAMDGGVADELCSALRGARLSPPVGRDFWASTAALMDSA